jgi:hypothetical protein
MQQQDMKLFPTQLIFCEKLYMKLFDFATLATQQIERLMASLCREVWKLGAPFQSVPIHDPSFDRSFASAFISTVDWQHPEYQFWAAKWNMHLRVWPRTQHVGYPTPPRRTATEELRLEPSK